MGCTDNPNTGEVYLCRCHDCPIHGQRNREIDGQKHFDFREYDDNFTPTGRTVTFLALSADEAVKMCLYTERLKDGHAKVGPTGKVVYSNKRRLVLATPSVEQENHP